MALREPIKQNTDPVTVGQLYVADGKVIISAIGSTVSALKTALSAAVVTDIDAPGRRVGFFPGGLPLFEVS
jgi:hypothetical protein